MDFTVLVPTISCSLLQKVLQCILVGCVFPVFVMDCGNTPGVIKMLGRIRSDGAQYLIGLARMKKLLPGVMQGFRGEPSQGRTLDTR